MEPKKGHPYYERMTGVSPRKEEAGMNYELDGQMDFSDFPELLPEGGSKRVDSNV